MDAIAATARRAGQQLAQTSLAVRNGVLLAIKEALIIHAADVIAANARDMATAAASGLESAVAKRLILDVGKIEGLIVGLQQLIELPDPIGVASMHRQLADGLIMRRVSCPLGVLCIIFEARPEAVIQIASLALKSGNALILKGGKEAMHSNEALAKLVRDAIASVNGSSGSADIGVPLDAVQLVTSREDVAELLKQDTNIDLVIPRGSNKLVRDVKAATRIPVMGHADGVCSVFIDRAAAPAKAAAIAVDSKTNYPAACNAAETLLVHAAALSTVFPVVASALLAAGVTLHCDELTLPLATRALEALASALDDAAGTAGAPAAPALGSVVPAQEADWTMEWLSLHMSVKVVADVAEAVVWINAHGSHHTDVIVTEDAAAAAEFSAGVDSAGVYHNASSRFADGYRYGFGAEVGISTNRIHARGPVGLEGLMTYKYVVAGDGHCAAQFAAKPGAASVTVAGQTLPALSYRHEDLPLHASADAAGAGAGATGAATTGATAGAR